MVLLVSCFGDDDTGGGLVSIDGSEVELVDHLSSTGLALKENRLLRLLRSSSDAGSVGEFLVYDPVGVERYYRIDQLRDGHDIDWDGQGFIAVSTSDNRVLWIAPDGRVTRQWKAPGEGDAWHLNSLARVGDELFVSAFGRYDRHREWVDKRQQPSGFIYSLNAGRGVIEGLYHPHSPRPLGESWLVCNSIKGEVVEVDQITNRVLRTTTLEGYTRGLAVIDDFLFVGESANRHAGFATTTASVAVVDRRTGRAVDRYSLPCKEVYDLIFVSPELAEGVKRGFRTNPARVSEQDQVLMFNAVGTRPKRLWAVADPLPPEGFKARISAQIPARVAASELVSISCAIENTGSSFFVSAPPNPVNISYRWLKHNRPAPGMEGLRTKLPQSLAPGEKLHCSIQVLAPDSPGSYVLAITLVQEMVAWFYDLDESNAASRGVEVV